MSDCSFPLSQSLSVIVDELDDVSMLTADEYLLLNGMAMHQLDTAPMHTGWTTSRPDLFSLELPLQPHYLNIFACQRNGGVCHQCPLKHCRMAGAQYDGGASLALPYTPPSAAMVYHHQSTLVHTPKPASCSASLETQQPEAKKHSRDVSGMRPPSLAATHPSKYQSTVEQKSVSPRRTRHMLDHIPPSNAWSPSTPESLHSPSPQPTAKPLSTKMGPPSVPRRRKAAVRSRNAWPPPTKVAPTPPESPRTPLSSSPQWHSPHTYMLDPMMLHSKAPTQWLYDANVDRRDTDLANGNVTSPVAMIGLPLGGMIEMANAYSSANGYSWERSASSG